MRNISLILIFVLTACAPQTLQHNSSSSLQPYFTATPSLTSAPNVIVIAETPFPTATPNIYIIQSGDTFSQLAEKFRISQDDLRAANPDVSPNSMSIGATLLIPSKSAAAASAATPTPVPAPVTQTVCHPSADRGLWCFALIQNNTPDILENVSAQITLLDENNNETASQAAFLPIDIIPPNSSLPVYVFFPNTAPSANTQVQLLSAIQLESNTPRYLPATLINTSVQINLNKLTAHVSGEVTLPPESTAATQVWIAAVAYDKAGQVVGVKRWEGGAIQPGGTIPFNFLVPSLVAGIDTVEFFVEARP